MRIILDDDMSKYVSLYLNREVKEIILDTESDSLKADFARFIKDLIEERAYSLAHTRYIYDYDRNCVAIFGFENFEEEVCYKYKKILKEIEETKEE